MRICLFLLLWFSAAAHAAGGPLPAFQPRSEHPRPLIAVIAQNRMTELVDYVVPIGVLRRSGLAQVLALSTEPGPVQLMPALKVQADATLEQFRQRYPQGADYLIVPAVHDSQDPALLAFIREQARLGSRVVGICDGVLVLGQAGLLHHRRATGHWYSRGQRRADFPDTDWQENRRYVVDGPIMTTSGVSAALPASLALVEAIGGTARAAALAQQFGVADWSPRHDSQRFGLGVSGYLAASGNYLAFWGHERFALPLEPGFDEVRLALATDAWARTFRSEVRARAARPVGSASGLVFLEEDSQDLPALPPAAGNAMQTLELALDAIAARYGEPTRQLVAAQLEYSPPERSASQARRNSMDSP
ncbi:putative intracellular protease/amidase [Pseudomonas nitritireducens]|uniref:Putative intracellular protease/amidase n=1 Tax=Pseudomonas nitroreducens TaxID=46680 RepID=A0A7W7KRC1_PSENT|nr:DJ-1/PfpI family protein [Pseudomonas nitritireducens]MBB4867550.1 putative intracellular protease/amidase [Pseudomonas nitritireducens]